MILQETPSLVGLGAEVGLAVVEEVGFDVGLGFGVGVCVGYVSVVRDFFT